MNDNKELIEKTENVLERMMAFFERVNEDSANEKKPKEDVQKRIDAIKAKLHAQNALLKQACEFLEAANAKLKKFR